MKEIDRFLMTIKEEKYVVRHFQSYGVENHCVCWVLFWANLLFMKIV